MKRLKQQQSRGTQETYSSAVSDWRNRGKGTGSAPMVEEDDASFEFPKSAGTKWKIFYQSNGKVPGYAVKQKVLRMINTVSSFLYVELQR